MSVLAGCASGALAWPATAGDWSGAYMGANLGGSSSKTRTSHSLSQPPCTTPATCATQQGILASFTPTRTETDIGGGVQAGYNGVAGRLMLGLEADMNRLVMKHSSISTGSFTSGGGVGNSKSLTTADSVEGGWVATLRPRLGLNLGDKTLVYATGGAAFSNLKFRSDTTITAAQGTTGIYSSSTSRARGWVAGFGAEYALSDKTSLKAEYQHLAFKPSASGANTSTVVTDLTGSTVSATAHVKVDVLRIGFNWKF